MFPMSDCLNQMQTELKEEWIIIAVYKILSGSEGPKSNEACQCFERIMFQSEGSSNKIERWMGMRRQHYLRASFPYYC